jgi:hypothetical protein
VKAHVVGVEASDSIGMSSAIFQVRGDGLGDCLGSLCLDGCECAKGNAESAVMEWNRLRTTLVESVTIDRRLHNVAGHGHIDGARFVV